MLEVFHLIRGKPMPIGYAEDAAIYRRKLWLTNPFSHMSLRTSIWGRVSCRNNWNGSDVLCAKSYLAFPCNREPWMDVDFVDLLAAQVLCEKLEPDLPELGFSRLPRHPGE